MVVERFSQNLINTGIFKLYVAVGFCATLIFFILNSQLFAPIEIVFGAILVTLFLRGAAHIIFSFIVRNFSLDKKVEYFDIKYNEEKIGFLLNKFKSEDYVEEDELEIKEKEIASEVNSSQNLEENK